MDSLTVNGRSVEKSKWRKGAKGIFIAETPAFIMKIHHPAHCKYVRFTVSRCGGSMLGSGTVSDVRTAMSAPEKMAMRCSANLILAAIR